MAPRGAGASAEAAHNGLFLIQLTGPAQEEWLAQLKQRGVSVVQYVPDDAYIARAQGVRVKELEALPFVQWTGPFKAGHKIHGPVARKAAKDADLEVSVLLAPDSTQQQLAQARGLMKKLNSESSLKFGHVWRGTLAAARLNALASSDAVLWIEPAPNIKMNDETASKIVGGDGGGHQTAVQALGYDGSGVVVSVADSGLHYGDANDMHPDLAGRVDALMYYGLLEDASDEHGHGTHVAGIVAANGATGETDDYGALWGLGVAPGAHIVAQRIFDGEGNYEAPPSYLDLTRDAMDAGADIGSNSWGDDTQGRYDISAAEFDALVRDGDGRGHQYILEFSAGNAGPGVQTVGSPAVAKNVIATGASQNERFDYFLYTDGKDAMADFSSRGPAEDGRIKPDLTAPGTWISSLRSPVGNDEFAWGDISFYYMFEGGTSQAGPHASGAAAVFVQYYRETHTNATPSPALVKAALINSATDMDDEVETDPVPNNDEGWGRIDLEQLIGSDRSYDFVDQSVRLTTGQSYERYVVITDESQPLFVTMAYTDVPAFPGAVPALVNDLNLEVIAPDGRVYRGNQFFAGESIADSASADQLNNVECVFIGEPMAGQYTVRVAARNVAQDARPDTGAIDQDFALVVSGSLPAAGTGFVFFDRRAYTVPGRINVKVVDSDLTGQASVNVTVRSTTQSAGVALSLKPSAIPGTFTGSVATVSTTTAGSLRITHGDTIDTSYFDASQGATRTATARADLLAPVITSVGTSSSFGKAIINWQTDEPATSIVRYSTNSSLNLAVTNGIYTASHAIALSDLFPGRTYKFVVISEDEAGNRSTNNNGGALFTFVAPTAATVLLVDNYQMDDYGPAVPLSVYTNTLNAIGVSYDVWSIVGGRPSPVLNDLKPYRVVMWRLSDSVLVNNTMTAGEQTAVQQYVQGGGSFFLASMEQLSRLSAGFVQDVLQVVSKTEDAGVSFANGITGNPISGGGLDLPLDYSYYESEWYDLLGVPPDISDIMAPSTNAFPILLDDFGDAVGIAYPRLDLDRTGRVVFLSFPLDAVSATAPAPDNRATLMQRIITFLAPGQQGNGSITLDNTEYTIPSLAIVEVGDSDLAGFGQVSVNVKSTSEPAGKNLVLTEFGKFGIFRGNLAFVATHSAAPASELLVANGDTILATYFDASRNASITFTARVETVVPTISGHSVDPGYVDATFAWTTSEPADSLVQYGESRLLGRTAYRSTLVTSHELFVEGLRPDQLYYYQIVSRDNAGNVRVDDNGGALYTFTTLLPYSPPWSDSMETTVDEWFVYDVEDSAQGWSNGIPQNGSFAHSGSRAWATDINSEGKDYVESYLISPPVYLTEGTKVTLKFWQNYEMFEDEETIYHLGEIAVITNTASLPVTIDTIEDDASGGWQQATYDLSAHSGKLVYIVFHYVLFTFSDSPGLGWMIDDVELTSSSVLRITNNLAQASFTVTGPTNFTGSGASYVNPDAPAGDYSVTYNNVPYYTKPSTRTGTLVAGGSLVLTGNYTFADANNNGISDAWEQAFFGNVSPSRTANTDTDGDGMSDLSEFVAGTNPNSTSSVFRATALVAGKTNTVLQWPATGRSYRVHGGAGLANSESWPAVSDWISSNSFSVPVQTGLKYFRVEVKP